MKIAVASVVGIAGVVVGSAGLLGAVGQARADDAGIRFDGSAPAGESLPVMTSIETTDLLAMAAISVQDAKPAEPAASKTPVFGDPDSGWWLTIAPAVGTTFGDETSVGLRASLTTFVAQDIQIGGELGLWYFQQPGDNAFGANLEFVLRWHFVNTGAWTVFADAGVGLLLASEDVPQGGTDLNFMPRLGVGFTRRISESGARFEAGLGWHHISNARINGDDENPGRDLPLLHFGFVFPL